MSRGCPHYKSNKACISNLCLTGLWTNCTYGRSPASRRAFDGELLPGDSVDWSTTFSILEFGDIIFHPCIVIPLLSLMKVLSSAPKMIGRFLVVIPMAFRLSKRTPSPGI